MYNIHHSSIVGHGFMETIKHYSEISKSREINLSNVTNTTTLTRTQIKL